MEKEAFQIQRANILESIDHLESELGVFKHRIFLTLKIFIKLSASLIFIH